MLTHNPAYEIACYDPVCTSLPGVSGSTHMPSYQLSLLFIGLSMQKTMAPWGWLDCHILPFTNSQARFWRHQPNANSFQNTPGSSRPLNFLYSITDLQHDRSSCPPRILTVNNIFSFKVLLSFSLSSYLGTYHLHPLTCFTPPASI